MLAELWRFLTAYNLEFLARAALNTVALSAFGCMVGFLLGFVLAAIRVTRSRLAAPARILGLTYAELFRRVPFLVTLFLVFYAFQVAGVDVALFWVAATTTAVIGTAYLSEVIRGGFAAVPAPQWDAAASMNLTLPQTLRYVVLPQAWKTILPPAFAFFLSFIKDSALASQIGVVELTYAAKVFNNRGLSPAIAFGSVLIVYFLISYPLARLGTRLEARLAVS